MNLITKRQPPFRNICQQKYVDKWFFRFLENTFIKRPQVAHCAYDPGHNIRYFEKF